MSDAGLCGANDSEVFETAQKEKRTILTHNCRDFLALAESRQGNHFGILLVYKENDPSRDMSANDIVRAIKNLEKTGLGLKGQLVVLNSYRY